MKKLLLICVLLPLCGRAQTVSLIAKSSSWKYLDNGTNQGTSWRSVSFSDAAWASGNAELGYGDGGEATVVSYGTSATNKYRTTYFRKSFQVANPAAISTLTLSLMRDDGAVVYLNGTEVARSNMPTGTISYTTLASTAITGTGESTYYNYTISPSLLLTGTNVIAVEVHQVTASSPDISFNLGLDATTAATCGTPSALNTITRTTTSATIGWGAVSGSSSYNVRYRAVGAASWISQTTAALQVVLSGLTTATKYEYGVQAVCGSTAGPWSATSTFSTYTTATDSLITTNASWKYLDNGSNQGTAWTAISFNDGVWASGNAELGYGDGDETTVVGYGSNSSAKYITTYFRKTISVTNPDIYSSLQLSVVRDDGIVVYINGAEAYRLNMPTGTIAYNTLAPTAISGTDESAWYSVVLSPTLLTAGTNVIAVEIHQQAASSTDISFRARLTGRGTTPPPVVTRGAYLQKVTPSSIVIRWRTDVACNSIVNYGSSLSYGTTVSDQTLTTEHIITLTGLSANTRYYYSIGSSQGTLQGDSKNTFLTAPATGTTGPVRVWVTGDFGNGSTQQTAVRDAYVNYTGTTATNLWIWLGDNAYASGTDTEYQNNVFTRYPDQLKSIPLYPAPGNHDYANVGYLSTSALGTSFPYFSNFTVPQAAEAGGVASSTPKYYSFNYANIHFISLDSYGTSSSAGSAMYSWLNSDLAANTQRWTVVYFHHTPYTKGSHDSDTETELINMRTNIVPLLENYHVDLVLCGHSHVNERSYLIKGHFGLASTFTPSMKVSTATNTFTKSAPFDGTIYAVCGTSGQSPGTVQAGYPMPCMYFNNNTNNCSMVLDVSGNTLSAKFLTSAGAVADQFTITKSGTREQNPQPEEGASAYYDDAESELVLNLTIDKPSDVSVSLYSISGQEVSLPAISKSRLAEGYHRLYIPTREAGLPTGIYVARVLIDGVPHAIRFFVP